ncbi:unnamed protein product, partial [Rotaria sp. Silwood1]
PERSPTLEEVNSTFFWNFKFGETLGVFNFIYNPSDIQNMAARFATAIVKEEYDFTNREVMDQIY